jgi:hypothetical protein
MTYSFFAEGEADGVLVTMRFLIRADDEAAAREKFQRLFWSSGKPSLIGVANTVWHAQSGPFDGICWPGLPLDRKAAP